jgi:hypothetical protein
LTPSDFATGQNNSRVKPGSVKSRQARNRVSGPSQETCSAIKERDGFDHTIYDLS